MSVAEQSAELAQPRVAEKRRKPRRRSRDTWWRHAVGILAALVAIFPVAYVVSAAFNADQSISGSTLIPHRVTLDNFRALFAQGTSLESSNAADYPRWYLNWVIVAVATSVLTVLLGALAAYAFSRFRFRGRRMGMLSLLLIQMFPQLLLVVAIYLIVFNVGNVFPLIGLNSLTGLIFVYLAGAMGVNTWLLKGFFDTIPSELDESARVDGATPTQIFWGVVLPLAAPILVVIGMFSLIATINEFAIANVLLQTSDKFTLPLGLRTFIDQQYAQHWGPFTAGVLLAAIPVVLLFLPLQKFIVRGLTAGSVKG